MATDEIMRLLAQYPTLTLTDDGTKVRCTLTEHEMPLKPEIIQAYASCKRYERLLSFYTSPYYQKYKQFFINCNSKKRNRSQAYCSLTKHFVNRTHTHLMTHVNGAQFADAYDRWMKNPYCLEAESSQSSQQHGPQSATHRQAAAAAAADDDDDDDDDDISQASHHETDAKDDDEDDDSCSDLYPEKDFIRSNEMDSADSSHQDQSKNRLKRRTKQKKPGVLKDLKAKMRKTDDDDDDD